MPKNTESTIIALIIKIAIIIKNAFHPLVITNLPDASLNIIPPHYTANLCLPIVNFTVLDHIQELVAVAGL